MVERAGKKLGRSRWKGRSEEMEARGEKLGSRSPFIGKNHGPVQGCWASPFAMATTKPNHGKFENWKHMSC